MTRPWVVLLDVDHTLLCPSSFFSADGYVEVARRWGVTLDPARYGSGRREAFARVFERETALDHDGEAHDRVAAEIATAMGADAEVAGLVAAQVNAAWNDPSHFRLYDDVPPALEALAAAGFTLGLISNTHRELEPFLAPFELPVSFALSSRSHGRLKPCPTIFAAALERAAAEPSQAVMVGDSYRADVEGAQAAGIRGVLLDRGGVAAERPCERIRSLGELPALLG